MMVEVPICPYCYIKEVFNFLYSKDEKLAENFIKLFNFDFLKVGHNSEITITKNFNPTIISEEKEDFDMNICENCENQSDYLKKVNGSYLCEVCRDED